MSFSQNTIMDNSTYQQQYLNQQPLQLPLTPQPVPQPVPQVQQQSFQQQILTRDGDNGNGNGNSGGNSGSGDTVSQDECTNQFPLPPSSLPTNAVPNTDETHIGVNLEFTPVIDIVVNKPKIRLGNFANGSFSTKCYRQ